MRWWHGSYCSPAVPTYQTTSSGSLMPFGAGEQAAGGDPDRDEWSVVGATREVGARKGSPIDMKYSSNVFSICAERSGPGGRWREDGPIPRR